MNMRQALESLEVELNFKAHDNLGATLWTLTTPQREAALLVEELTLLTNPVDYNHTRCRGERLAKLDHNELWRYHPSTPKSLNELLHDVGISPSEASDLITWERTIYPYLEIHLGLRPYELWLKLGKTKRRRLTPVLRGLLVGNSSSDKVANTIQKFRQKVTEELLEEARQTWIDHYGAEPCFDDEELLEDYKAEFRADWDEVREIAKSLLETAETLTSKDLEEELSPEPTPPLVGELLKLKDGTYRLLFNLTEDQLTLLKRRFPDRLELLYAEEE